MIKQLWLCRGKNACCEDLMYGKLLQGEMCDQQDDLTDYEKCVCSGHTVPVSVFIAVGITRESTGTCFASVSCQYAIWRICCLGILIN